MTSKREFYERVVKELSLDTRDPFTNLLANACALADMVDELKRPTSEKRDVEWVVNSLGELGVKVGDDFQWLYKGHSLRYEDPTHTDEDDARKGQPMLWRHVGKREFGECCHPVNYADPTRWGTVDVNDGLDWKPIPASKHPRAV